MGPAVSKAHWGVCMSNFKCSCKTAVSAPWMLAFDYLPYLMCQYKDDIPLALSIVLEMYHSGDPSLLYTAPGLVSSHTSIED